MILCHIKGKPPTKFQHIIFTYFKGFREKQTYIQTDRHTSPALEEGLSLNVYFIDVSMLVLYNLFHIQDLVTSVSCTRVAIQHY